MVKQIQVSVEEIKLNELKSSLLITLTYRIQGINVTILSFRSNP